MARLRLSRTGLLLLLVGVQVLLLGFMLAYFASVQGEVRMELEARPEETEPLPYLPGRDVLDTASLLAGPEFLGIDLPTEFRRGLAFDPGQMTWFLLERRLVEGDPLVQRARKAVPAKEFKRLREGLGDGVLSFLYGVGSSPELARQNWSGVAVRELQASPLLPWTKHLDFLALSSLGEAEAGGLGFVTALNQGMLLVLPPHDPDRLKRLGGFTRKPNAVVLPEGLHPLGPGLWALVLAAPPASGHPAELDLLVEREDGRLVLFSGSGLNPPLAALRQARRATGRDVALYVGDTGWTVGWDTSGLEAELTALSSEFPDLVVMPGGRTSLVAHGVLESLLGPRYVPGRLGARVRL